MNKNNQPDQSHIIRRAFEAANISQPIPLQGIPGGITPSNIGTPEPRQQTTNANNGFTTSNLQPPVVAPEPTQEGEE